MSQSTVSRRMTALEDALDVKLFVRRPSGYDLTPRGQAVLPETLEVEAAFTAFADSIEAETRRLTGKVRVSTVEAAANNWVIPAMAILREDHPEIEVELVTSDHYVDIASAEADFAIRFGPRPTQENLVARHLLDMLESVYAAETLVARLGLPENYADLAGFAMIGSPSPDSFNNRWIAQNAPMAQITQRANFVSNIMASVQSGLGAAILPCMIGDTLPGIVRLFQPIEELTTPGWMVPTDIARRQPHIRAVIDSVVQQIQRALAAGSLHLAASKAA